MQEPFEGASAGAFCRSPLKAPFAGHLGEHPLNEGILKEGILLTTVDPQNKHETLTNPRDHHLKTLVDSQRSHIIGRSSHCSNFSSRWPPGRTDGRRRTDDPQIRAPTPSHRGALSRAHAASLARTHATQTQAQSKSISRFGGSANAALTPPTSDI